jgi:anti-sigma factor RsiW
MSTPACSDENMQLLLGFSVLGRLSATEQASVAEHLRSCPSCRAERDEIDDMVSLLGQLPGDTVRELVAELGIPAEEPAHPAPADPAPAADRTPVAGDAPAGRPAAEAEPHVVHGAGKAAARRNPPRRQRHRVIGVAVVAAVAVVAVVATTLLMFQPWTPSGTSVPVVTVASVTGSGGGVEVSAELLEQGGQVRVDLTATGLGSGPYQLVAVTDDGGRLLLGQLSGAGTYSGVVPVRLRALSSFDLLRAGGGLAVSAPVLRRPAESENS